MYRELEKKVHYYAVYTVKDVFYGYNIIPLDP